MTKKISYGMEINIGKDLKYKKKKKKKKKKKFSKEKPFKFYGRKKVHSKGKGFIGGLFR